MRNLVLVPLLCALGACSSLGLATPQTLDQKLAYGYSGVATALNTIATATIAGQLTSAQATNANGMVLQVKGILDTARALETSNAPSAQNDLTLALSSLASVQQYLTAAGVK
jgi:putative exporter of polyketide antibiotics